MSLFRWPRQKRSDETVEALRAVKRIAEALHADEPVPASAAETVDRVLEPPIAWEDLLRRPGVRSKGCQSPCRP